MTRTAIASFVVGVTALTPIVASAVIAYPRTVEIAEPVDHATLWRNGAEPTRVMLATPIVEPELIRDDDDTLWLAPNASPAQAQRFDPRTLAFDAPARHEARAAVAAHARRREGRSSRRRRRARVLRVHRARERAQPHLLSPQWRVGPGSVARVRRQHQQHPPVRGSSWRDLSVASGVAVDRGDVLLFTWSYEPTENALVIDVSSGAVKPGPAFGRPKDASGIYSVRGEWLPGGGMLLVDNGNRERPDGPARSAAAAAILVVSLALLAFALVKRKLAVLPLVVGRRRVIPSVRWY